MEDEFTARETERQDIVDNAIANLISELIPVDCEFDWDIELIGDIRDAVQEVIVDRMGAMTEQEFYPYREIEPEEQKKPKEFTVTGDQLLEAMRDALDDLDGDDFASVAGELLGGECFWERYNERIEDDEYSFVPNILYSGAFNHLDYDKD